MTEVYRPPQPRFSDEAMVNIAERLIKASAGCHIELSEPDATYLAAVVTRQGAIPREFDAACLSAYRSGRELAYRDLAERLRDKADEVEAQARTAESVTGATMIRIQAEHFQSAADLIEQWAKAEAGS